MTKHDKPADELDQLLRYGNYTAIRDLFAKQQDIIDGLMRWEHEGCCQVCGTPIELIVADEGTCYYRPVEGLFTEEQVREMLVRMGERVNIDVTIIPRGKALERIADAIITEWKDKQ